MLRVFVERLHVRMGRRVVEKEVVFLHILPVVALGVRQTKEPFFEDGIGFVPQGQGETQATLVVADPQQAILTPAVGARAGVIMREECTRVAIGGIILSYRCPLALRKVGSPAIPRLAVLMRFL